MSVIAPKFRLGYFLKGIFDNLFWIITLVTLAGIPAIQIGLFYLELPVTLDRIIQFELLEFLQVLQLLESKRHYQKFLLENIQDGILVQ